MNINTLVTILLIFFGSFFLMAALLNFEFFFLSPQGRFFVSFFRSRSWARIFYTFLGILLIIVALFY